MNCYIKRLLEVAEKNNGIEDKEMRRTYIESEADRTLQHIWLDVMNDASDIDYLKAEKEVERICAEFVG